MVLMGPCISRISSRFNIFTIPDWEYRSLRSPLTFKLCTTQSSGNGYPMLQNALATSSRRLRRLYSGAVHRIDSTSTRTPYSMPRRSATMVATTTAVLLWYLSSNIVHNDVVHVISSAHTKGANSTGVDEDGALCAVVWGSNK